MIQKLDELGWPEAKIIDLSFNGKKLQFSMLDIMSFSDPLKYEIVNILIPDIESLKIELIPFVNGKYRSKLIPVDYGSATEKDEGFEGIIFENPLTDIKAEYFWISSDVRAKNIEIARTGKYEFIPRAN